MWEAKFGQILYKEFKYGLIFVKAPSICGSATPLPFAFTFGLLPLTLAPACASPTRPSYSTVTLFARFLGLSTSQPFSTAM